ncbi:unnamed protein product, partial [Vitis vinifera]|uniref:Uncharacterized protein n=1 Tax=Vitis vinifera TaxID=29760 RepID=D7ST44_VITVI|eukprot:XP_010647403.1 PREDICTED: probable LRR receptor-like serine/threonine-protein kinase At5g10290 isoform X1 [Vitis vinifera]
MCSLCSTLQGNGITGEIPKELGYLSNLTTLDLENNRLTGEIPSNLGNLKKLQFLILNQNNLTGTIPKSLSSIHQSLINLQLASNDLSGQIPEDLFQVPKYNFTGNRLNCGRNFQHLCASDNDSGGSHKPKIGLIVGIVGGLIGLLLFATVLCFLWKSSRRGYKREVYVDVAGL